MDLDRVLGEAYILQTIGKLDVGTAAKVMKALPEGMYENVDEALRMFEQEESIREDVVEWIQDSWSEAKGQKPKVFAASILDDFLMSIE